MSQRLGIFPQYCAQQQIVMILKEKVFSFTGDDFEVKDQWGNVVIHCKGTAMSLTERKKFMDAAGNHLFDLKDKPFHLHRTLEVEDPAEKPLMSVKQKFHKAFLRFAPELFI
ncbi:tubby C-terminal-like domain-containing protein [Roridomyces roridus]|uniref:Tubby C-terminal-like domain-containing protein n=1 Tax=Roridomyces roridus TaxID=1738132 RepID=A0AAD7BLZ2_9AGAR|nr:tubby C-terminal-like domain-containing protein [Roridomyces roridus]